MRRFISAIVLLLSIGCASTAWRRDAAKAAGLDEGEARELIQKAAERHQMPAWRLTKEGESIGVWLARPRTHEGTVVWFKKESGVWVETGSSPVWE